MSAYFITGIGTGIGKTLVSAIITEALRGDYWKPIQAGNLDGTDCLTVQSLLTNDQSVVHPESYLLKFAASPHIAAPEEGLDISIDEIISDMPSTSNTLIIEGAGGLLSPINKTEFNIDIIKRLNIPVIIVSRNYLGSINHSLMTAKVLKYHDIKVAGWIFNDEYLDYENDIVVWSGYPWIASVRHIDTIDKIGVHAQAMKIKDHLKMFI
ncbi:MAG: dethiobiotin synthase [Ginsengibacter sp.]